MGSLYKKGKFYYVDYYNCLGKRIRKSTKTGDKKLAETIRLKLENEDVLQRFGINKKIVKKDLEAVVNEYIDFIKRDRTLNTFLSVKKILNCFFDYLGNVKIFSVENADIENYKNFRIENIKRSSFNTELKILRAFFNYAVKQNFINFNPCLNTDFYRIDKNGTAKYLTNENVKDLLKIIEDENFKNLILFYLYTGCRLNEALNLTWQDIDFKLMQIIFKKTKSKVSRIIPIHNDLLKLLRNIESKRKNDKLFDYHPVYVSSKFRVYLNKIGIKSGISVHILRHTFASKLIMSGVGLYTLQKLLGHSDSKITEIYAHLKPDYLKDSVDKLDYSHILDTDK